MKNTGWICPKCGRVYAPFIMECSNCNNNEIKPDPCIITPQWSQDYSKYKSEVTTDTYKRDQNVSIDDEQLKYTTSRDFNSEYLTYTRSGTHSDNATTTGYGIKLDKEPMLFGSQMICDSQGCREVDLFGRPIKPIQDDLVDEDTRKSSFEVMLENDDISPTEIEAINHLYYVNHITTPENKDSKHEWACRECGRKYYKFPTRGCLCGAKLNTLYTI